MRQIILIFQTVFGNLHFTVSPVELVFDKFIDFSGGHPQVLHGLVSGDFLCESFVHRWSPCPSCTRQCRISYGLLQVYQTTWPSSVLMGVTIVLTIREFHHLPHKFSLFQYWNILPEERMIHSQLRSKEPMNELIFNQVMKKERSGCLLWRDKRGTKENTYIWVSVLGCVGDWNTSRCFCLLLRDKVRVK